MRLHLDLETYSDCDLPRVGHEAYARMRPEILMVGYAFDDDPIALWDSASGTPPDALLLRALADSRIIKWAFNAPFEMAVLTHAWGIDCPPEQWRCTKVLAAEYSFSGGLGEIAKQVGVESEKMDAGTRLINKFSKPQRPTKRFPGTRRDWRTDPQDWDLFGQYCRRDVEVERQIYRALIDG